MDQFDGEALIREHLSSHPDARHAALHDPEYAAGVHHLRAVLDCLEPAMTAEGVPHLIRRRVGVRLVAACLGTDEAYNRMREHHRRAQQLAAGTAGGWERGPVATESGSTSARP
jgi:hypothetical protein